MSDPAGQEEERAGLLDPMAAQLEGLVASFVAEHRLAGAAAGVVVDQDLAWSTGIGVADQQTGRRSDARTLYEIGSISKTFTASAILQLRDEGRLGLDDPLVST
jgi:CubicO group peptidase (beta-lactamase class C family)